MRAQETDGASPGPQRSALDRAQGRLTVGLTRILFAISAGICLRDLMFAEDRWIAVAPAIVAALLLVPAVRGSTGLFTKAWTLGAVHGGVIGSQYIVGTEAAAVTVIVPACLAALLFSRSERRWLAASLGISLATLGLILASGTTSLAPPQIGQTDAVRAQVALVGTFLVVSLGSAWFHRTMNLAAEQAVELARAANAANQAKTSFLANMSHELRTPVAAILGFSGLIERQDGESAGKAHAEVISRNANHLLHLLDDILDLSKVEAGALAVDLGPTDVGAVVNGVVEDVQPLAAQRGVHITAEATTRWPSTVRTDARRLRQILLNLVGNAAKFGSTRVRIELSITESELVFAVQDDGPGISPDEAERLFQPFVQGKSGTEIKQGTGLGLILSRRLAGALGGTVALDSSAEPGARFTVAIPLDLPPHLEDPGPLAATEPETAPTAAETGLAGVRCLIAEDNPDLSALLAIELRHRQAILTVVGNGVQALEAGSDEGSAFDVLILDVDMPQMDGLTATRRLRELGVATPVIALTAFAMDGDRERCLAAGCNDYLGKPVRIHALVEAILRLVPIEPKAEPIPAPAEALAAALEQLAIAYRANLPTLARELEDLVQAANLVELARSAHKLTGSAGTYGFVEIGEAAAALEEGARQGASIDVLGAQAARIRELALKA